MTSKPLVVITGASSGIGAATARAFAAAGHPLLLIARRLEPMQALLKRQAFVCGTEPAYADYILFSLFHWARVMSPKELLGPEDPLCAWRERMLDLYDGFARNVPTA